MTTSKDNTTTTATTTTTAATEPFQLELHAWIERQQNFHGIRHEDYGQYQKYCTNRLKRLSHHPDVKRYLICSNKFAPTSNSTTSSSSKSNNNNKSKSRHAYVSRKKELLNTFTERMIITDNGEEKEEEDVKEQEQGVDNDDDIKKQQQQPQRIPHENILWYFLVLSERAWACAKGRRHASTSSTTNSSSTTTTANNNGTIKRAQVLKKYKKAKDWAQILVDVAKVSADETTLQECQAYLAWMTGNYALEKMDYSTAIKEFATAMSLCHTLSQTAPSTATSTPSSSDDKSGGGGGEEEEETKRLVRQDLFLTRADTVLRPLFRYCQYELKQAGEIIPVEEPQGPTTTTVGSKGNGQDDDIAISFRGYDLVLDNKDLRVLLLKLQSLQEQSATTTTTTTTISSSSSSSEKSFLEILSVLDDAMEVVQSALQGYTTTATVVGPTIQAKKNNLLAWKGYLQYQKTLHVMDHTQSLLENISGHAERVHIYDALLQHANSLLSLPKPSSSSSGGGVDGDGLNIAVAAGANDGDGGDDEEDEFSLQVQANCLRLRALKCFHMAWYYYSSSSSSPKYDSALALFQQAAKLSKRAQEEIAACDDDMPHADEYLEELERLPLSSSMAAVKAAMYLQQGLLMGGSGSGSGTAAMMANTTVTDRPLLLRLHEPDAGMVMADVLPMPLFCKPVFFDMAYDYAMDVTNSVDQLQTFIDEHTVQPEEEKEEPASSSGGGGLFGWLTGSG